MLKILYKNKIKFLKSLTTQRKSHKRKKKYIYIIINKSHYYF